MSAPYPVLPVAGGALLRALASLVALVTYWLKELARARRHRREANALAGLDRRMLADIGITRSDVRDAFSEPFWDDPTALHVNGVSFDSLTNWTGFRWEDYRRENFVYATIPLTFCPRNGRVVQITGFHDWENYDERDTP